MGIIIPRVDRKQAITRFRNTSHYTKQARLSPNIPLRQNANSLSTRFVSYNIFHVEFHTQRTGFSDFSQKPRANHMVLCRFHLWLYCAILWQSRNTNSRNRQSFLYTVLHTAQAHATNLPNFITHLPKRALLTTRIANSFRNIQTICGRIR